LILDQGEREGLTATLNRRERASGSEWLSLSDAIPQVFPIPCAWGRRQVLSQ